MAELPIMPVKTDALIADTTHMSAEQFGVYWRVLCALWRHGGIIAADDKQLAAIGGVTIGSWRKMKAIVMAPLTVIDGTVSQKRLLSTFQDVQEVRKVRAAAAETRWKGKRRPNGMQMHEQSNVQNDANQNHIQTTSTTSEYETARARSINPPSSQAETPRARKEEIQVSPELRALLATK